MALIIPLFIPHEGCPHACVFCNQHSISGEEDRVGPAQVTATIEEWLSWKRVGQECVVAFYGGSFSGLALDRQEELLQAVQPYLRSGQVDHIRISTRPDYIDQDGIFFLKDRGVHTIELGTQSLDDRVLQMSGRGHTGEEVCRAVELLKNSGCVVGMQLMLGLPGQNFSSLRKTVAQTVRLQPDMVRIYPALVVQGSLLATLWKWGEYTPLSLEKAVLQAAYMKKQFDKAAIRVIRMGLQPGASLEQTLLAGPYHPAFGELVASRLMLRVVRTQLARHGGQSVRLLIHPKDQSVFRGMSSKNMHRLSELGLLSRFSLETRENIPRHTVGCVLEQD